MVNFSIAMIAKNESSTIPRLAESLRDFFSRGGEAILVDTGSTDGTAELARSLGFKVTEVGDRFLTVIDENLAKRINDRFIVDNEEPAVKAGDKLFDFASARNYSTELASNDMICTLDADESYTVFDIDRLQKLINEGWEQFEYNFVFAHDSYGRPALEFVQSKFFNKRKVQWTGIVHEVLTGECRKMLLGKDIILLEHWQNPAAEHRSRYLAGLAVDCYQNPAKDRQSHYFARELLWHHRPKSAIKEFKRHIAMNRWLQEKAQSMIYIGDAYAQLGNPEKQIEWYQKAFYYDSSRRESLVKTALFYRANNKPKMAVIYAQASLEIPFSPFYSNDKSHYENVPHEILYWGRGWTGNVPEAQKHILKALEYQPLNSVYLRDLRYYFNLPKVSIIIPTLGRPQGLKKCLDSIKNLNYPEDKIETIVLEDNPRIGVPKRLKEGVERSTGDLIVYGSNDIEFEPDSLILAVREFMNDEALVLLAFNTGKVYPDEGNICEHFAFRKAALESFKDYFKNNEIFDTEFNHVGVDNLLWAKCKKLMAAKRSEVAKIKHNHFTQGMPMDKVYNLGWSEVEKDRALLKKKLSELDDLPPVTKRVTFNSGYDPGKNNIEGWMTGNELIFLYKSSKQMEEVCEIGSWMGRSTHALLTGCKGKVHAVDHFMGSANPTETGNRDVFPDFMRNVGHYPNLVVHRKSSLDAVNDFEDGSLGMVFIDAGHQYNEVIEDIKAWRPKATRLLCGHDYIPNPWDVKRAVDDTLGKIELIDSLWYLWLDNPLHILREKIDNSENFNFVKMGDGEMIAMKTTKGENIDGQEYSEELKNALKKSYKVIGKVPNTEITRWKLGMEDEITEFEKELGIKCTADHDLLLNRSLTPYIYNFWRAVKLSKRRKIFIGPKRLEEVNSFLNTDMFIEVPESNAFGKPIVIEPEDNDIFLFSAGPAAKVWIADLLTKNSNITCIDCGSAFDPIFVGQTRTNQLPMNKLREFYKELLDYLGDK